MNSRVWETYSKTSQDGHPSGNVKLAVLQRWPSYGNTPFMNNRWVNMFGRVSDRSKWTQIHWIKKRVSFEVFLCQNCYETFWNKYLSHLVKLVLSLLAVMRGKFTLHFSFGEWKSGRLIEVGRLKVAVLWNFFIKDSLGVGQGNELLAVLQRWPS